MSCNKAFNIKNVPMNATWEIEETYCVSTKDLTISDLAGKYFLIYDASGAKYKVWFDNGVATEPVVASSTAVAIDITLATTAALIATAIAADLPVASPLYDAVVKNSTTVVITYTTTEKIPTPAANGTAGELLQLAQSAKGGSIDLGLLDGDVTFDPSIETVELNSHQTGGTIIGQLITSVGGEVSLTLKEYLPSRYRELFEAIGGKVAATSVTGFGSAMVGKNLISSAKRLILKPVYKNDNTENYTVWKAVPELGSITFSGEAPNTLPLTFTAYIDDDKASEVNVWAYGDIATLP